MDNMARIKQLDQQLATLAKIVKQGEFVGAGLTVSLTVGPQKADMEPELVLELVNNLEPLLDLVKRSLEASRGEQISHARQDLKNLQAFFAAEEQASR